MDRLTAATVFMEATARGSISAAATHLGMSRAMATRYINAMEEWAGGRLLHRTTRKLSLTAAGEDVLAFSKQMIAASKEIPTYGRVGESEPKGLLRVTASSILAEHWLASALVAFLAKYPAVSVDLRVDDRAVNLAEDRIDLAMRVTKELDGSVIARKIGVVSSVICAGSEYLARYGTPETARDLIKHNCLTYAYFGQSEWVFHEAGGEVRVPVRGNFATNEAAVILRAALDNAGIALLPAFAAEAAVTEGRLVKLLPSARVEDLTLSAVYLSRRHMAAALRALIDFLAADFHREWCAGFASRDVKES